MSLVAAAQHVEFLGGNAADDGPWVGLSPTGNVIQAVRQGKKGMNPAKGEKAVGGEKTAGFLVGHDFPCLREGIAKDAFSSVGVHETPCIALVRAVKPIAIGIDEHQFAVGLV